MRNFITTFTLWVGKYPTCPFTLRDGNALRVYLPFEMESNCRVHFPFGFHLPFGMEVPIGSSYPLVSIYHSGWKVLSGPFTLQVGKYQQFHLPFRMEVLVGSIDPSGSIYLSGFVYPSSSIYPSGWKCLSSPFTL